MPDLSADAVANWLSETGPAIAADLCTSVPSRDEDPAVHPAMLRLGEVMDEALARAPEGLRARLRDPAVLGNARTVLAQIGAGRRLRLLSWLTAIPDFSDFPQALLGADQSDTTRFLRAELRNLHRLALLNRMFAPERIAALLEACSAAP